jgi:AraC family transcriptional regulator
MTKFFIKNMVCPRCISTVENILKKVKIPYNSVILGEVEIEKELGDKKRTELQAQLKLVGFELIDTRRSVLIEKIKKTVILYISILENDNRMNLSEFVASKVNYEYTYISNLFSSVEGMTLEQYYILQRLEKVKELLVYDQYSLSEIADKLGYSSIHHLSSQFKKVTGLTPSHFKSIGLAKRRSLDDVI